MCGARLRRNSKKKRKKFSLLVRAGLRAGRVWARGRKLPATCTGRLKLAKGDQGQGWGQVSLRGMRRFLLNESLAPFPSRPPWHCIFYESTEKSHIPGKEESRESRFTEWCQWEREKRGRGVNKVKLYFPLPPIEEIHPHTISIFFSFWLNLWNRQIKGKALKNFLSLSLFKKCHSVFSAPSVPLSPHLQCGVSSILNFLILKLIPSAPGFLINNFSTRKLLICQPSH